MYLGATLYCPYRTVLGTDWSQRQVQEFETQGEAAAEADAQMQRREKRGYRAVAW